MSTEEKEQLLLEHSAQADERGLHVDGCFYCGGNHPSDCCRSDERDEWWRDETEPIR